jgi:hypothetical protein
MVQELDRTSDHRAVVVFAPTEEEALALGGDELAPAGDVEVLRRPTFDRWAPGPVPAEALLADGWWLECGWCEHRIDGGEGRCVFEDDDADDDDARPCASACLTRGEDAFCDAACLAAFRADRARRRRELDLARALALLTFPGCSNLDVWGTPPVVTFRFPGSEGNATWRPVERHAHVQPRDLEPWRRWRAASKARPA